MPSPRGVVRQVQDMLGTEVCTLKTYLGHDVNWAQRSDTRSPLDIMTSKKKQYWRKNTQKCLENYTNILEYLRLGLSNPPILLNTMTRHQWPPIPHMCSTRGALEGRVRCLPSGHMQIWNIAKNTPCSQRIASGALHKRPFTEVRPASVGPEYNEGLPAIWGPLAG